MFVIVHQFIQKGKLHNEVVADTPQDGWQNKFESADDAFDYIANGELNCTDTSEIYYVSEEE